MENEKKIDVLNTLIQINNDRIEGYETAFKETEEQDLKAHFSQFMLTSQKCKQELVDEVTRLGGEPTESTRVSGKSAHGAVEASSRWRADGSVSVTQKRR